MKMELLPPDTITSQLQQRLLQLKEALMELTKNQKNQQKGHLRVSQRGSARPQYYHYTTPTDFTGKYIRKKNLNFAKTLAQKDYEENIIPLLQKEITVLEEYLTQTSNGRAISEFYESLCPARRCLITPVTLTDDQYAASWQKVSWTGRPFSPDAPLLYTARGERVRSKSEVIIADTLFRQKIPYRYEFPLTLRRSSEAPFHSDFDKLNHCISGSGNHTTAIGDTVTLHPDFLCLNTRTRAEFFWEHCGLMDDPTYSKNTAGKLRLYTENGILPGRNLIITMETKTEPPTAQVLEKLIAEYLT